MGRVRCPWVNQSNDLYVEYHDREWGRAQHDDTKLFEMLILEGAQAGLSWEIILRKREHYIEVFDGFDPAIIAKYKKVKVDSLLKDPGVVRNRLKIESAIVNAKAFIAIQKEFGSFNKYIWGFVSGAPVINSFETLEDYPAKTELSDIISKDLKRRGFKFVGSTIIYAFMQAVGIVQDHSKDCYLHGKKLKVLKS